MQVYNSFSYNLEFSRSFLPIDYHPSYPHTPDAKKNHIPEMKLHCLGFFLGGGLGLKNILAKIGGACRRMF